MRILIIHTSYLVRGGEDSVVENEANLLQSAGHEIKYLQFSNSNDQLAAFLQLPFNYSSYNSAKKAIIEFKPDVVHIHNLHFAGSPSVIYAIRRFNVPIVVTLHNYRLLCPSGTLFFNGRLFTSSINKLISFEAVTKGVYQNSKLITLWMAVSSAVHQLAHTWMIPDRYIVLGANAKKIFQSSKYRLLADKLQIKPNFCFPASVSIKATSDYYLYVGRLSPEKGIDTLLSAFAQNKLPLKIVGSGPLENRVISFIKDNPNIEFLGIKDKADVFNLLANATALIFTSLWYETFGMVIIEAFACGTPVIASKIGEAQTLVEDKVNGLLFKAGNELDLCEKVTKYQALRDTEKNKYRLNALNSYRINYTPESNLKQLCEIYQSAILNKQLPNQ